MSGATLPLTPDPFSGRTLGKYEVLCRLSTGGMSEIYLAFQKGLAGFRKIVVLKSILPDIRGEEEFVRMFLDEAKITAAFNHPNIAQVFDLDIDQDELFLAMEFVPGCTLVEVARACRQRNEPIPTGFALMSVRDTALALHYAHTFTDPLGNKQTVIHRDVAEKNIMVTYEGTTKLLDFGIAKSLNRTGRTTIGMVKGTSGYMSPEQILGEKLDPRSDIFSLGVVLHECLTGMRLFHGRNPEEGMMAALKKEVVAPPSRQNRQVPPELDAVVLKALAREREDRYSTALEFGRAIEKASRGLMFHAEQSGELIQRLFSDRREQTRALLSSSPPKPNEVTGELRLAGLLGTSASATPARSHGSITTPARPTAPLMGKPPPPTPEVLPEEVTAHEALPGMKPPASRPPGPLPATRVSRNNLPRATPSIPPPVRDPTEPTPPKGRAPQAGSFGFNAPPPVRAYDDIDDVEEPELRTIPATALPDGLLLPPEPSSSGSASSEILDLWTDPGANLELIEDGIQAGAANTGNRTAMIARQEVNEVDLDEPAPRDAPAWNQAPEPATHVGQKTSGVAPVLIGVTVAVLMFAAGVFALGLHRELFGFGQEPPLPAPPPVEAAAPSPSPLPPVPERAEATPRKEDPPPVPVVNLEPPASITEPKPPAPAPNPREKAVRANVRAAPQRVKPQARPEAKESSTKKAENTSNAAERAWQEDDDEKKKAANGPGQLTLVTEPYAKVLFKSQDLGVTPLFKASLPSGKHTLKLIGPDQQTLLLPVEIREGQVTAVRISLSDLTAE